ncbi:hypothetical protein PC129_g21845 [Phytophthora cactorum]|uniref:Uncharacterized protein n=1 Tax=Phytophthora cactorum TaxID=29920 RepID=A0A329SA07_9STRA|nr:hypothetical protein Pcac1_g24396 [Phytophthora cactorum]KAG2795712.1 hypothetical protein PC111_g22035 [Phytophthora cactorum]KAG2828383.1 hypothetical protein PC112_g8492 [Phytophthora cactorum]KAG2854839.1 hypothetical protein PC113_g12963 [Phytophthora cactorum]KAG2911448.1 hypothetical protein PC114_g9363 [Phytophthora cactorum]
MTLQVFETILSVPDAGSLSSAHANNFASGSEANWLALEEWCRTYRRAFAIPAGVPPDFAADADPLSPMFDWLAMNPTATRHLFAFPPYPEVAAKGVPLARLCAWGCMEAAHEQYRALAYLRQQVQCTAEAANFIGHWLDEAGYITELQHAEILGEPARWEALLGMHPDLGIRARPTDVPESHRYVVHVLPYVARRWPATQWEERLMDSRRNGIACSQPSVT